MSTRKVNSGIRVTPEMKIEMKELYRIRAIWKSLDKSRRWTRGTSFSQFWEKVISDHLKKENNPTQKRDANSEMEGRLNAHTDAFEIIERYKRGEIDIK